MPSLSLPASITSLHTGLGPVLGDFDFPECVAGAMAGCEDNVELFARDGQAAVKDKFFIPGVVTTCGLLAIVIICWIRLGCNCNWKRKPKPYNSFSNVPATTQKRTSQSAGSALSSGLAGRNSLNGVPTSNPAAAHTNNAAPKASLHSNLDGMSPPNHTGYDGRSTSVAPGQYDGRSPSAPQTYDGRSPPQQGYGAYSDGRASYVQAPYTSNLQTVPPAHSGFYPAQQTVQMSVNRTTTAAQAQVHGALPGGGGYAMSDGSTRIGSDTTDTPMNTPPIMPGGTPYFTPPIAPPTPAANRGTTYTDGSDDYGQPARQNYAHTSNAYPPQYADGASPYGANQYPPEKGGR